MSEEKQEERFQPCPDCGALVQMQGADRVELRKPYRGATHICVGRVFEEGGR